MKGCVVGLVIRQRIAHVIVAKHTGVTSSRPHPVILSGSEASKLLPNLDSYNR
jgi:hypothetical protein